jgi:hypothetical protein
VIPRNNASGVSLTTAVIAGGGFVQSALNAALVIPFGISTQQTFLSGSWSMCGRMLTINWKIINVRLPAESGSYRIGVRYNEALHPQELKSAGYGNGGYLIDYIGNKGTSIAQLSPANSLTTTQSGLSYPTQLEDMTVVWASSRWKVAAMTTPENSIYIQKGVTDDIMLVDVNVISTVAIGIEPEPDPMAGM